MSIKSVTVGLIIVSVLWCVLFTPFSESFTQIYFWLMMSVSAILLISFCLLPFVEYDWTELKDFSWKSVVVGLLSAAALYGIFYVGNYVSSALFDFARPQVMNIYGIKDSADPVVIGILLLFLIGPAEEIFWRGLIQRQSSELLGNWVGPAFTALYYTAIHLFSMNIMLVAAAAVCSVFWGLLYKYYRNLPALIISHAVWDVAVFVVFPI